MDKFKSCKDCLDRVPGCHATCEGYNARKEAREEQKKKERAERAYKDYLRDSVLKRQAFERNHQR